MLSRAVVQKAAGHNASSLDAKLQRPFRVVPTENQQVARHEQQRTRHFGCERAGAVSGSSVELGARLDAVVVYGGRRGRANVHVLHAVIRA